MGLFETVFRGSDEMYFKAEADLNAVIAELGEDAAMVMPDTAYFLACIYAYLGRGTASMMDQFIVVIEPGARSIQTYEKVKKLAADLGISRVRVVANKVRDRQDEDFLRSRIPEDALLGFIHYEPNVIDADRRGMSPYDISPSTVDEIRAIKAKMDSERA